MKEVSDHHCIFKSSEYVCNINILHLLILNSRMLLQTLRDQ